MGLIIFENLLIQYDEILNFNYDNFINYIYEIININVGTEEYKEKIKKRYNSPSKGNTLNYFIHNESEENKNKIERYKK